MDDDEKQRDTASRTTSAGADEYSLDEQTGKLFRIVPEKPLDAAFAVLSYVYLFLALGFFLWLLFDTWARKYTFARWVGFSAAEAQARLNAPIFRSFAYAFVGGALGGVIAGYRSCVHWHSEQRAFGWRFGWKYLFYPWLGATLALFVYAVIGSGIAVIGGNISDTGGVAKMLFALAIGSLVGYGSPQVVRWLDSQVNKLFQVVTPPEVHVPDLTGLTQQEARKRLTEAGLKMGQVLEQEGKDVGKVIEQEPRAGSVAPAGGLVKITIAAARAAPPEVRVPDLAGMTQQEAGKKLTEAGLKMGPVLQREQEGKEVGKVIEQEPRAGSVTAAEGLVKITIAAPRANGTR
jgi:hypothetical protein